MSAPPKSLATELALLGVLATLWGSSYLFIKIALVSFPPATLITIRVTVAALILLAFLRVKAIALPRDVHTWRLLMLQSILNSSLAWLVLAWGTQYLDSGLAGVLNSTSPLFVFALTMGAARHSPLKVTGVILGFLGVLLVMGSSVLANAAQQNLLAQAAVLFGAFLYACAAIHGKKLAHIPPTVTATGTMICAAVCLLPISVLVDRPWNIVPQGKAVMAAMCLSVLCTALATAIYFRLLRTLGSLGVASQSYLRASISVLLGFIVLKEQPGASVFVGLALTILGVALINTKGKNS